MAVWAIVLIVVAVVLLVAVICAFNALVRARNKTKEAFSSVDVHLKLRYDLIPNLVSVVEGYMKHESDIIKTVTKVRQKSVAAKNQKQKIEVANEAGKAIQELYATAEEYPELKSNKMFRRLSRELVEVEDKISAARRFYNSTVNQYNNMVMQFPMSIVAFLFGFKKQEVFELSSIERSEGKIEV